MSSCAPEEGDDVSCVAPHPSSVSASVIRTARGQPGRACASPASLDRSRTGSSLGGRGSPMARPYQALARPSPGRLDKNRDSSRVPRAPLRVTKKKIDGGPTLGAGRFSAVNRTHASAAGGPLQTSATIPMRQENVRGGNDIDLEIFLAGIHRILPITFEKTDLCSTPGVCLDAQCVVVIPRDTNTRRLFRRTLDFFAARRGLIPTARIRGASGSPGPGGGRRHRGRKARSGRTHRGSSPGRR